MAETASPALSVPVSRPKELRPEQKQQIFLGVAEMLHVSMHGPTFPFTDPTLGGAADLLVSGAFVCLKRGKHLRSCCGFLGKNELLANALQEAVERTVWEDVRFPPLSPSEVSFLEMEVWLLHPSEPVEARGEQRVHAVQVGKHGLQVVRGPARGLLLPSVPLEHGWDARKFLEHVCIKAGLHPSLWKDDETTLFTFEGQSIRGRLAAALRGRDGPPAPLPVAPEALPALTEFCRNNIANMLLGATPQYYLPGGADGQAAGAAIVVRRSGASDRLTVHQLSLRPGIPIQATLFQLSQQAAKALASQGADQTEPAELQLGVSLFFDAALHGSAADPHLDGFDPASRALLVTEKSRSAIVYDPGRTAVDILERAARQARVRHAGAAAVYSLAVLTEERRLAVHSVPRASLGPVIRPPALAGRFYPADPHQLQQMIDDLVGEPVEKVPCPAAMVPHAGLVYSGRIAANVLKRVAIPPTVIVLGPKHTSWGVDWAVAPQQAWALPGRSVASDPELARQLAGAIPGLELDALAHQHEHGIEVELPFLAHLAPDVCVVGIAIGGGDYDDCLQFAEGLAAVVQKQPQPPLLLISSDMNHYATDAENRRLDALALDALQRLDPRELYDVVTDNGISMCGVLPAVIVLETLRLLGMSQQAQLVDYGTSADVSGDPSRVVGYAGMLFG